MSFGKYSLEQSRRFYFASDTSYILCELNLPHGPHVIGVVGRGPGVVSATSSLPTRDSWTWRTTRRTTPACDRRSCSPTSSSTA